MSLALLTTAACQELGFTEDHEEIGYCESAVRSFLRHMNDSDLPAVALGGSARDYKRQKKARLKALKQRMADDVATDSGLDTKEKAGIFLAIVLFFIGGPFDVLVMCVAAVAGWCLEHALDKHWPDKVNIEEACAEVAADDAKIMKSNVRSVWVHICLQLAWLRHAILH